MALQGNRSPERRRSGRMGVSKGMWVSWYTDGPRSVSRVRDLSAGGVFVCTTTAVAIGTPMQMLFSLPEGELRLQGIVRHVVAGQGVGVEFARIATADTERLQELLRRIAR